MNALRTWTAVATIAICLVVWLPGTLQAQSGLMDPELMDLYEGTNINPFDASATNNLALKLIRQGRYERASKLLQRASRLAPDRTHIQRNVSYLQLLIDQMRALDVKTAQVYDRSFNDREVPFVPEPWGLTANTDSVLNPASTVDETKSSVSTNPFDAKSIIAIADIKEDRGDLRGALTALRRAEALSPWLSGLDQRIKKLQTRVSELGVTEDRETIGDHARASLKIEQTDNPPPAPWLSDAPTDQSTDK